MFVYWALFLTAFFLTQIYWVYTDNDFFCDMFMTIGSSSVSVDLICVGIAILIWMANDFWRMGFSVYTYFLMFIFGLGVAVSVTVPWYLALRVSRQCKIKSEKSTLLNT
jgi:hypothetical protein